MVNEEDWRKKVDKELSMAQEAREQGFEGRARVCARRAAGFAVETFLQRQGVTPPTQSAYGLLEMMGSNPTLPEEIQETLQLLTLRVNEDHDLPEEADLIQESEKLIHFLFSQ